MLNTSLRLAAAGLLAGAVFGVSGAAAADDLDPIVADALTPEPRTAAETIDGDWLTPLMRQAGLVPTPALTDPGVPAVPASTATPADLAGGLGLDVAADPLALQSDMNAKSLVLGFTLSPRTGLSGEVAMTRFDYDFAGLGIAQSDGMIGSAELSWAVTRNFRLTTDFQRTVDSAVDLSLKPRLEDQIGGGVSYAITPRFAISARGAVPTDLGADTVESLLGTPGEAEFNADYLITPFLSGSVNYTYESYSAGAGDMEEESTIFLSVKSKF